MSCDCFKSHCEQNVSLCRQREPEAWIDFRFSWIQLGYANSSDACFVSNTCHRRVSQWVCVYQGECVAELRCNIHHGIQSATLSSPMCHPPSTCVSVKSHIVFPSFVERTTWIWLELIFAFEVHENIFGDNWFVFYVHPKDTLWL